jgi:hypothetical protein
VGGGVKFDVGQGTQAIDNDATYNNANVSIECSVTAAGSGYDVTGKITLNGVGTFSMNGTFDGTNNPQKGITATFSDASGLGTWSSNSCTVTFTNSDFIAIGRVRGLIDCPTATDNSKATPEVCDASATFLFQRCN